MSFSVEYSRPKEDIFEEGDKLCKQKADMFKKYGGIFVDPDFPPIPETLGTLKHIETGELLTDQLDNEWLAPQKFSTEATYRHNNFGKYQIWTDPQPFHVCQGMLGDCWLIAAIMCLTQKRVLLEELVPRRDYTIDQGVVQVRLFIDGKWQVIMTDYHLPHKDRFERFAKMPKKQAWVAFIEKAYAKTRGTYGGLAGGNSDKAFTCLTGCMSRQVDITPTTNPDKLWEDFLKWKASDFLIAAATPDQEDFSAKKRWYDRHEISDCHAYALLNFIDQDGHRLIHFGSNSTLKWNGKWSDKPGYDQETLKKWSVQDRQLSHKKTFWMELNDFLMFFDRIYVGEFHEGYSEIRLKQKISRKAQDDTQILRLDIKKRSRFVIEVTSRRRENLENSKNLFINIHRSNSDNKLGELIHTAHIYDYRISSNVFHLDPGTFLVVLASFGNYDEMVNDWVVRSEFPLFKSGSSLQFISCPFSTIVKSAQEVFLKYGKVENYEKDNVTVYTWHGEKSCFVMVDNLRSWDYVRVKATAKSEKKGQLKKHLSFNYLLTYPVPPMSRSIVAYSSDTEYGQPRCDVEVKYYISYRFMDWLNLCDYYVVGSDLEMAIPLRK